MEGKMTSDSGDLSLSFDISAKLLAAYTGFMLHSLPWRLFAH